MWPVRLENSSHNGVGPEALGGAVLGLHLLGLGRWVGVAGVQHGLQDAASRIYEPFTGWEADRTLNQ